MRTIHNDDPLTVFCGYPENDRTWYEALARHLASPARSKILTLRHPGLIRPGADWRSALDEELSRARVIVLLVSEHFPSDEQCWYIQKRAMRATHAQLVPIRVHDIDLSDSPIGPLLFLPRNKRSVAATRGPSRNALWRDIAAEIVETVRRLRQSADTGERAAGRAEPARTSLDAVKSRREHGYRLYYQGRGNDALAQLRQALGDLEGLLEQDPANVVLKKERAHVYDRIGQCEYAQGRFEHARAAHDQAFEIRTALCVIAHDDQEALRDLATSRFWRAHLSFIRGDLPQAHDEQIEGMRVCQKLLAQNPTDLKAARAHVVLQTDLGTTLFEMGNITVAEQHLRTALDAVRRLAAEHSENLQLQRDLSVGLFRLAELLIARGGDASEAARLCEESVETCWELAYLDPTNVQWRRHLATARISMGEARLAQRNDITFARGDFEFAAGTMGALAALESDNLQGQRHYALSERKLGDLACREEDWSGASAAYRRGIKAMEAACASATSERWKRELHDLEVALQRVREVLPRTDCM